MSYMFQIVFDDDILEFHYFTIFLNEKSRKLTSDDRHDSFVDIHFLILSYKSIRSDNVKCSHTKKFLFVVNTMLFKHFSKNWNYLFECVTE